MLHYLLRFDIFLLLLPFSTLHLAGCPPLLVNVAYSFLPSLAVTIQLNYRLLALITLLCVDEPLLNHSINQSTTKNLAIQKHCSTIYSYIYS